MGYRKIAELLSDIFSQLARVKPKSIEAFIEGPILRYKLIITEETFIQIYFNEETGTTAFALVSHGKRIFGIDYDTIRGWHKHPPKDPDKHITHRQTRLSEFLDEALKIINQTKRCQ